MKQVVLHREDFTAQGAEMVWDDLIDRCVASREEAEAVTAITLTVVAVVLDPLSLED